jgi:hypothetical protein
MQLRAIQRLRPAFDVAFFTALRLRRLKQAEKVMMQEGEISVDRHIKIDSLKMKVDRQVCERERNIHAPTHQTSAKLFPVVVFGLPSAWNSALKRPSCRPVGAFGHLGCAAHTMVSIHVSGKGALPDLAYGFVCVKVIVRINTASTPRTMVLLMGCGTTHRCCPPANAWWSCGPSWLYTRPHKPAWTPSL